MMKKYIVHGFLGLDIREIIEAETEEEAIAKLIKQIGRVVNYDVLGAQEVEVCL